MMGGVATADDSNALAGARWMPKKLITLRSAVRRMALRRWGMGATPRVLQDEEST
jgi:hypothetical protein